MAILKHRPRVRLRTRSEVIAGQPIDAVVLLRTKRQVPIESLDAVLIGDEVFRRSGGRRVLLQQHARLSGPTTLPKGGYEYPCFFELPEWVPPSHEGQAVRIAYRVGVHVSISWWPDRRTFFGIKVVQPPAGGGHPPGRPVRLISRPAGMVGTEPYAELSLGSDCVAPGKMLAGAVALGNVRFNRYEGVTLSLMAREVLKSGGQAGVAARYSLRLKLSQPAEGEPIPFTMRIPWGLTPSFERPSWALVWALEVRVQMRSGSHPELVANIPLKMGPAESKEGEQGKLIQAPPSVGSPRLEQIWRSVGDELGLTVTEEGMYGALDDVELWIRQEHRGRQGVYLVGELSYRSLHLDLTMHPARGLRRRLGGGVTLGLDADFDRKYYIIGREDRQVVALLTALRLALAPFTVQQMDDQRMVVDRRGSGQDRDALARFVTWVRELAKSLLAARWAIPPPTSMAAAVPAWRELARRLGSDLELACMAVFGTFAGQASEVKTIWTRSRPTCTRITLYPVYSINEAYHLSISAAQGGVIDPDRITVLPEGAPPLVRELTRGAFSFGVDRKSVQVELEAPLLSPQPALDRLEALARLCKLLRPGGGPYR